MRQQGDSDDRIRYWDEYAVGYSSYQQGFMPGRIVDWMLETGYLRSEFSVLEVGCGPGTYSLELAPKVRILTCMDSSERMLARLSAGAKEKGLTNIELFHQDWERYIPKKGCAACIASLCCARSRTPMHPSAGWRAPPGRAAPRYLGGSTEGRGSGRPYGNRWGSNVR